MNLIQEIELMEQYTLDIFNNSIDIYWGNDVLIYVPIHTLCKIMGLNYKEEIQLIQNHAILKSGLVRGKPNSLCASKVLLRADMLALWLTVLNLDNLFEDTRPDVELFQHGAALVLQEAFVEGRLLDMGTIATNLHKDSIIVQAYKEAIALAGVARQRLLEELEVGIV